MKRGTTDFTNDGKNQETTVVQSNSNKGDHKEYIIILVFSDSAI